MPRTIDAAELKRRLDDPQDDFLLIDLMPPTQYLLLHLPGAINLPLEYLHDMLEFLPHDKDLILYCTNPECEFGEVGAKKLELHGFDNVVVFSGGLAAWEDARYEFATVLLEPDAEHEHKHEGQGAEAEPKTEVGETAEAATPQPAEEPVPVEAPTG